MEKKNMIIRIPEPCHEDWNKMTPDANGKFCGSCQKSVFDFSNKTDDEIKNILMHYKDQKVCGRFKETQVNRPLNLRVNLNEVPSNVSMTKIFALALLLSFGSHLFACYDLQGKVIQGIEMISDEDDDKNKRKVGEVEVVTKEKEKDKKKPKETCTPMVKGDVDIRMVAGGIRMVEEVVEVKEVKEDSVKILEPKNIEEFIKGKVAIPDSVKEEVLITGQVINSENITETTETQNPVQDTTVYTPIHIFEEEYLEVMGEMMAVETVTEEIIVPEEKASSVEEMNDLIFESTWNVFPNPAKNDFTVQYEVFKQSHVRIDILDLQGRLISTICNNEQHTGRYLLPINLDMANGLYLISLQMNGKISTKRLVIEE